MLEGIRYVTDERGNKLAVQIDLRKHRAVWEDFQDVLVAESRRGEKSRGRVDQGATRWIHQN